MTKDEKGVFEAVVHVGESHIYYRGGIGAVLAVYCKYFPAFKAIGTHRHISKIGKILYFAGNYFKLVWTLMFDRKIKIIHIHGSYGASVLRKAFIVSTGKTIFRKKIIYQIHSSEYPQKYTVAPAFHKKLIDYLLHHADLVGCLTPNWKTLYIEQFGLSNTIVIPNMIQPPDYNGKVRVAPPPDKPLQFAYLGLIHEKKGVFDMVRMVVENKAIFTNKLVIHIGGIGKVEELKTLISTHGLEKIINFRGWIGEKDKSALYRDVDAFILPSYNEGLPVVILEAMSYGLPVIATSVGGIPEIMEHGKNGFLFEKGDVDAMKDAINQYISHPDLLRQHDDNSLQMVKGYFPEQIVPRLATVYRNLLNKNSGA